MKHTGPSAPTGLQVEVHRAAGANGPSTRVTPRGNPIPNPFAPSRGRKGSGLRMPRWMAFRGANPNTQGGPPEGGGSRDSRGPEEILIERGSEGSSGAIAEVPVLGDTALADGLKVGQHPPFVSDGPTDQGLENAIRKIWRRPKSKSDVQLKFPYVIKVKSDATLEERSQRIDDYVERVKRVLKKMKVRRQVVFHDVTLSYRDLGRDLIHLTIVALPPGQSFQWGIDQHPKLAGQIVPVQSRIREAVIKQVEAVPFKGTMLLDVHHKLGDGQSEEALKMKIAAERLLFRDAGIQFDPIRKSDIRHQFGLHYSVRLRGQRKGPSAIGSATDSG